MPSFYGSLINQIENLTTLPPTEYKPENLWSKEVLVKLWLNFSEDVFFEGKKVIKLEIYAPMQQKLSVFHIKMVFSDYSIAALTKKDPENTLNPLLKNCGAHYEYLLLDSTASVFPEEWEDLRQYKPEDHQLYDNIHQRILREFKELLQKLDKAKIQKINLIEPGCAYAKVSILCLQEAIKYFDTTLYAFDQSEESIKKAENNCPKDLKGRTKLFIGDTKNLGKILKSLNLPTQKDTIHIVINSGAINKDVFDDKAAGIKALQAMYPKIDFIISAGKTECLFNSCHETTGFRLEKFEEEYHFTTWVRKTEQELCLEIERTLDGRGLLNLALTPNPITIINLVKENKHKVKIVNLSLAYIDPKECSVLLKSLQKFKELQFIIIDSHINNEDVHHELKNNFADVIVLESGISKLQGFFDIYFYEKLFQTSVLNIVHIKEIHPATSHPIISGACELFHLTNMWGAESAIFSYEIDLNKEENPLLKLNFANSFVLKLQRAAESSKNELIRGLTDENFIKFGILSSHTPLATLQIRDPFSHFDPSSSQNPKEKKVNQLNEMQKLLLQTTTELIAKEAKNFSPNEIIEAIQILISDIQKDKISIDKEYKKTKRSILLEQYDDIYQHMLTINNLAIEYYLNKNPEILAKIKNLLTENKSTISDWITVVNLSSEAKKTFIAKIDNFINTIREILAFATRSESDLFSTKDVEEYKETEIEDKQKTMEYLTPEKGL